MAIPLPWCYLEVPGLHGKDFKFGCFFWLSTSFQTCFSNESNHSTLPDPCNIISWTNFKLSFMTVCMI